MLRYQAAKSESHDESRNLNITSYLSTVQNEWTGPQSTWKDGPGGYEEMLDLEYKRMMSRITQPRIDAINCVHKSSRATMDPSCHGNSCQKSLKPCPD